MRGARERRFWTLQDWFCVLRGPLRMEQPRASRLWTIGPLGLAAEAFCFSNSELTSTAVEILVHPRRNRYLAQAALRFRRQLVLQGVGGAIRSPPARARRRTPLGAWGIHSRRNLALTGSSPEAEDWGIGPGRGGWVLFGACTEVRHQVSVEQ